MRRLGDCAANSCSICRGGRYPRLCLRLPDCAGQLDGKIPPGRPGLQRQLARDESMSRCDGQSGGVKGAVVKATFEPFLLEVMKDTTTSVADKVAKVRGWTFPGPPREMREEERTALQKLLDSVCTLLERVKPGFATSLWKRLIRRIREIGKRVRRTASSPLRCAWCSLC
jgi:hypothetical protein